MSAATMQELGSSRCFTMVMMYPWSDDAMPGGTVVAVVVAAPLLQPLPPPPPPPPPLLPPLVAQSSPLLLRLLSSLPFSSLPSGMVLGVHSRIASSMAAFPSTSSNSLHATASTTAAQEPSNPGVPLADCSRRRSSLNVDADVLRRMAVVTDSRSAMVRGLSPPTAESAALAVRFLRMPGDDEPGDTESFWVSPVALVATASAAWSAVPSPTHIEDSSFRTPISVVPMPAKHRPRSLHALRWQPFLGMGLWSGMTTPTIDRRDRISRGVISRQIKLDWRRNGQLLATEVVRRPKKLNVEIAARQGAAA